MRGGGCAAEVSLLEPRVLLAGTGETDPPSDPIASPDPTSPSTPTSPPTQSQSDAAASSPGLSFASSLVSADKAYSATTLDAHVGLALDYVDADKSYYDAEDASFRLYGEDLDAADGDYLDALEAAETAYYDAESAAYQQLEDDFDRARANYDPAASAAGAVMYDAVGAAWDQRDATVADADAARDDAYVAADSLYAEYWEALDDAERQYQADLDAASEGAYSTFEDAERAAAERRQQAEADAEPLYDRYWDAIVAADAEFDRAVAAADEVLRRAEADAWGVFSAAEAVAADERETAERAAWDARSEATDEADRTRDAAVTAAEEQWDAAEETAWESHEDRRLDYFHQSRDEAENRKKNTGRVDGLISYASNRPEASRETLVKCVTEMLLAHEATGGDIPQLEDVSGIDKKLNTTFHARVTLFRDPGPDQFRMVVLRRFDSDEAPTTLAGYKSEPHKLIEQAELVVTAEGTVRDRPPAAGATVPDDQDHPLKHEVSVITYREYKVR